MAPGLKLGDCVQAEAVAVLGNRRPERTKKAPAWIVVDVKGCGHQRKFNGK